MTATLQELEGAARAGMEKIPRTKHCLENLSAASQARVAAAAMKPSMCNTCRWRSGCHNCHAGTTLQYYLNTESLVVKTTPMLEALEPPLPPPPPPPPPRMDLVYTRFAAFLRSAGPFLNRL